MCVNNFMFYVNNKTWKYPPAQVENSKVLFHNVAVDKSGPY